MEPVYFDHNATTPLDPRVFVAMEPWLGGRWGNPSSVHRFGQAARNAVEEAREKVAALLGAKPPEIVFTASGTEANNGVILGVGERAGHRGHLVLSAFEHPSIREAAAWLERRGMAVTRIAPGRDGIVPAAAVVEALRPDTRLVALMLANNELGTLQPVAEVAAACRERGIPVLTDAVQAIGKVPVDVRALGATWLVLGAHKLYGPLGAAAIRMAEGAEYAGLLGGGQERHRRAGTENVPAIVGLGEAAALARAEIGERGRKMAELRDRFEAGLMAAIPEALVHCQDSPRLPNTSHVAFPGVAGDPLLIRLDLAGYAVSTGSACSSGAVEPSKTLLAAGYSAEEALSSLRISFGLTNRPEEVDRFLEVLAAQVAALRQAVPAGGGAMSEKLTAVAMSGGLDSSVTAWLLARQGRPVIGLSMLLWDHSGEAKNGRCCGALDLGDARRVAQQAGIPHYTLRMDEEFREKVVDPFVADYLAGRTPSPCVRCNTWVKFDLLLERARSFGATEIATGHYARIVDGPEGKELHTSADPDKDQSYYLFELTQEQLAASSFPLGEMSKPQVREIAREAGLVVAEKGESMEVCFVAGGIAEFVAGEAAAHPERFGGLPPEPATVIAASGGGLGSGSEPYYRYTVGQRKGLGISAKSPLYVLQIEPEANRVVVGTEAELAAPGLHGERLHWIGPPPAGPVEATVKIRSRHPGVASRIVPLEDGEVRIEFSEPQRGVTPGQAAVFYQGTRVLGGCWIRGRAG